MLDAEEDIRIEADDAFYTMKGLEYYLREGTPPTTKPHSAKVGLPKISLPQFDDDCRNWSTFRDCFLTLHRWNNELSSIERFHYLLSCSSREPLKVVRTLSLNKDNYQIPLKPFGEDTTINASQLIHILMVSSILLWLEQVIWKDWERWLIALKMTWLRSEFSSFPLLNGILFCSICWFGILTRLFAQPLNKNILGSQFRLTRSWLSFWETNAWFWSRVILTEKLNWPHPQPDMPSLLRYSLMPSQITRVVSYANHHTRSRNVQNPSAWILEGNLLLSRNTFFAKIVWRLGITPKSVLPHTHVAPVLQSIIPYFCQVSHCNRGTQLKWHHIRMESSQLLRISNYQ